MKRNDVHFALPFLGLKIVKPLYDIGLNDELSTFSLIEECLTEVGVAELDVLLVLVHFFIENIQPDGLVYFSTDDILLARKVERVLHSEGYKSGYKKIVRSKVSRTLKSLNDKGIFFVSEYKKFCYAGYLNKDCIADVSTYKIPRLLVQYHPIKKSWHKSIGFFLLKLKRHKQSEVYIVQVKKILSSLNITYRFLAPNEIRTRFEDTLDDLAQDGLITEWYYKSIDENLFPQKGWLDLWSRLSVVVSFKTLAQERCFLNF